MFYNHHQRHHRHPGLLFRLCKDESYRKQRYLMVLISQKNLKDKTFYITETTKPCFKDNTVKYSRSLHVNFFYVSGLSIVELDLDIDQRNIILWIFRAPCHAHFIALWNMNQRFEMQNRNMYNKMTLLMEHLLEEIISVNS